MKQFFTGKAALLFVVATVGLVAAFYCFNAYIYEQKVAQNFEGEADPEVMTLGMKTWIFDSALYNDGRKFSPIDTKPFTLTFESDGKFSATTDCNMMGGGYAAGTDTITFSQIFRTEMYCEGSKEAEFASLLENTQGYHFTSRGQLIWDLKLDSGSAIFR